MWARQRPPHQYATKAASQDAVARPEPKEEKEERGEGGEEGGGGGPPARGLLLGGGTGLSDALHA